MRITSIFTVIVLGASSACASGTIPLRQFPGVDAPLTLSWSDEFDGNTLDRSLWNVEINGTGCGNNELQYYIDSPDNVAVRDGNLVLTARRAEHEGRAFTSGRINSRDKYTFTYGVAEARVKLPTTANGLWPAVWFMGNDISECGWPRCGEIDLLEMGHLDGIKDSTQNRLFNGAIHYGDGAHQMTVGPATAPESLQDGEYHSFYLVWTPESIKMYVDDATEPYMSVAIDDTESMKSPGYYFHKPAFILFNLAVGGNFPDIHTPEGITALNASNGNAASMLVDYIRIYTPSNQQYSLK